jgi:hypothetical protein
LKIEKREKFFGNEFSTRSHFIPSKGSHSNCLSPKWFNMRGHFESDLNAGSSGLGTSAFETVGQEWAPWCHCADAERRPGAALNGFLDK